MIPPEFLKPGFAFETSVWCEHDKGITQHELSFVSNDGKFVSYWKACRQCGKKLADRMPLTEWVFLSLKPDYIA